MTEPEAFCAYFAAAARLLPRTLLSEITPSEWDQARNAAGEMLLRHALLYPFDVPVPKAVGEILEMLEAVVPLLVGPDWPPHKSVMLRWTVSDFRRWLADLRAWRAGA